MYARIAQGARATRDGAAPSVVHDVLATPGEPLPASMRAEMEADLGHDFGQVRVHADERAATSAAAVGAAAYTVGRHVVFAGGFPPTGSAGRKLLRHELAHTVQQGQRLIQRGGHLAVGPVADHAETAADLGAPEPFVLGGPVLQRQPQESGKADLETRLAALFAEYEKAVGKPPPGQLKDWARRYELARRGVPEAPPLDVERMKQSLEIMRIHNTDPPLPHREEPLKLAPGAVRANEILPFAKGTRVQVTHLLAELLTKHKSTFAEKAREEAEGSRRGDVLASAPLLLDLLTDPDVTRSVTAEVLESTAIVVRARIDVPAISAKGTRPAIPAQAINFKLEAVSPEPTFDLAIGWPGGSVAFRDITARREQGRVVTTVPVKGVSADLAIIPQGGGAVVAQAEHPMLRWVIGSPELRLVRMEPLTAKQGSAEEAQQKKSAEAKAAVAATPVPSGHDLSVASGAQGELTGKPGATGAVYSASWRFVYALRGEAVGLPLQVQLDYAPKPGMLTGSVGFGGQVVIPAGDVPVTLSIIPGLRAGAAGLGDEPDPVLGPNVGVQAGVGLGRGVEVFLGAEYFKNLMKDAAEKGFDNVATGQAGVRLRL